jgi:hypothetical protein
VIKRYLLSAISSAAALGVFSLWAQQPPSRESVAVSPAGGSVQTNLEKGKGKAKGRPVPQGPTPKLADGTIDLSGIWTGGGPVGDLAQGLAKGETIPINAKGLDLMKSRKSGDDPEANCLPTGIPRIAPYPWRIVQTKTHIFFLFEGNIHSYRQIFIDGRKHPEDPDPTWYGHSVGHWEKDTMVIDTIGFNDRFWFDFRGHPHSEKLHTIERYTRPDFGTLTNDVTIEDSEYYTKPFTLHFTARHLPLTEELMEYICQENEQDSKHIQGPAGTP